MKINEIVIKGMKQSLREADMPEETLTLRASYQVGRSVRGEDAKTHKVRLEDQDIIELVFEDGTTWLSSPGELGELFPETVTAPSRSGEFVFELPGEVTAGSSERGIVNKAFLKVFNIFAKKKIKTAVKDLAAKLEEKQLEGKTGLFKLSTNFKLQNFSDVASGKTFCLLIHGTASSVSGSFGALKNSDLMKFLVKQYPDSILAFQHRTLTESPLQNVRDLVKALPDKCTLHLVTTSRGGLVGEALSRFCIKEENMRGFTSVEIDFFKKEYPKTYFESLEALINEIRDILKNKKITVEKFIRIACPARGTTLASKRLDGFFNITFNLLGFGAGLLVNPAYSAFRNLVAGVIETKNSAEDLPGLEAQNPSSPFIKVLNGMAYGGSASDIVVIDNSLVVISGNSRPALKISALWIIASKLFFMRKNDLVVDTVSMSLGTKRSGLTQEFCYEETDINHFKYFENKTTSDAIEQALKKKWGEKLEGFAQKQLTPDEYRDGFDLSTVDIENPLEELEYLPDHMADKYPLKVSISKGDLYFARYPVMAGHFENDGILFAEKNISSNLNGILNYRHQLGIYPGPIGSSAVILTDRSAFKGAIIIGLGEQGNLTSSELTNTVEQGVANYLLNLWHNRISKDKAAKGSEMTGISSLIIGCGYAGLSIEASIKAIIQGVYNANTKIRNLKLDNPVFIEHLEFIELYDDKAVSSLFSISRMEKEEGNSFKIIKEGKGVKSLLGSRQRITSDETQAWWNRLSVGKDEDKDTRAIKRLVFKSSTRSSREEEQQLYTTPALIENLIKEISTSIQWTAGRARAIFELLIPNDFKDQLKRHGNIIWVLDEYTASYPWELLQDKARDTDPICVTSGMIRQLSTSDYRKVIRTISKNNVLIVADPDLEGFYGQLPGALAEGQNVKEKFEKHLKKPDGEVTCSFNENHTLIIDKMFRDDYKIIHLSGHGVFDKDKPEASGMVIGKNQYLSAREISQMSTAPELVFVNCCHLGKTDSISEELYQKRYLLAANIGTQLIKNGVRCVIAAGWAVDDKAAKKFADVFYECLFNGDTFGVAVQKARKIVYENYTYTNTWGAYQCYGDPFYKFENIQVSQKNDEMSFMIPREAELALANLREQIEIGELSSLQYLENIDEIGRAVDKADIRNARITETEALILLELREYKKACDKFTDLLKMEEATFSFSVAEKYYNAQAKQIIEEYKKDPLNKAEFVDKLDGVIQQLRILINFSPTSERLNILASTFKRKAFLLDENDQGKSEAYEKAAHFYHLAYSKFDKWYPLTNWLIIESILVLCNKRKWGDTIPIENVQYELPLPGEAARLLDLKSKSRPDYMDNMNYWDMIAAINIKLCSYILDFTINPRQNGLEKILEDLKDLWEKAGSKGKRFAEIEHLEFIIDGLSMERNKNTGKLRKNINQLLDELEKLANL